MIYVPPNTALDGNREFADVFFCNGSCPGVSHVVANISTAILHFSSSISFTAL